MGTYTTKQGDVWDLIAWRVYGRAMLVHHLLLANPEHLETVVFGAGVSLRVPDIPAQLASAEDPPWRRR